jgi:hypothetical protein
VKAHHQSGATAGAEAEAAAGKLLLAVTGQIRNVAMIIKIKVQIALCCKNLRSVGITF